MPATPVQQQYSQSDYVAAIRAADIKGILKWASGSDAAYIQGLIDRAVRNQVDPAKLVSQITKSDVGAKYLAFLNPPVPPGPGYPVPTLPYEPGTPPPEETPWPPDWSTPGETGDIRATLEQFLAEYGLPPSLMAFIEDSLSRGMSYNEIVIRLRQTPEYLSVFPENALREERGFAWMPESQILEYRDEARRLAKSYLGIDVSNAEIAGLIGKNKSLSEWEGILATWTQFKKYGPVVRQALEQELGYQVTDDRLFAFMSPEVPTPELDLAFSRALMRGQPATLGLGMRPEEEADVLTKMGFSPEEAFQGYQGIASELPRVERMKMVEDYLDRQTGKTPTNPLGEASYGLLFRALMLRDTEASDILNKMLARQTALWQAGGGPAGYGAGLLSPESRQ